MTSHNLSLSWRKHTKHGYPPGREEKAIEFVLQQAELFASAGVGDRT